MHCGQPHGTWACVTQTSNQICLHLMLRSMHSLEVCFWHQIYTRMWGPLRDCCQILQYLISDQLHVATEALLLQPQQ